ncbi:hypothetical protein [Faecalibaculum rodentium]
MSMTEQLKPWNPRALAMKKKNRSDAVFLVQGYYRKKKPADLYKWWPFL